MSLWGRLMFAAGLSLGDQRQAQQRRQSVQRAGAYRATHNRAFLEAAERQKNAANSVVETADVATRKSLETVPLLQDTLRGLQLFGGARDT